MRLYLGRIGYELGAKFYPLAIYGWKMYGIGYRAKWFLGLSIQERNDHED